MMKRKRSFLLIVTSLVLLIALVACAGQAPAPAPAPTVTVTATAKPAAPTPAAVAPALKFSWAAYTPVTRIHSIETKAAIDKVVTDGGGKISIDWFPAEQLLKAMEVFGAIAEGRVQMASSAINYHEGDVPAVQLLGQFAVFKSNDHIRAALEPMREALQPAFAEKGVYLVSIAPSAGPFALFSNTRIPLAPEDIKGLKMRAPGKVWGTFLELAGASPSFITAPELYTALQRKTVDGIANTPGSTMANKWSEQLQYAAQFGLSQPFFIVIANLKWWQGLPDSQRQIIQNATSVYMGTALTETMFYEDTIYWDTIKQVLKVGVPSKEQAAAWYKLGEQANQNVIKALGNTPVVQKIQDVIKKYER